MLPLRLGTSGSLTILTHALCSFPALPFLALKALVQLQRYDEAGTELLSMAADPQAPLTLTLPAIDTLLAFAAGPCLGAVQSAANLILVGRNATNSPMSSRLNLLRGFRQQAGSFCCRNVHLKMQMCPGPS